MERLPDQPIFYPVTNERYASEIASRWNVRDDGVGYVTRFLVRTSFVRRFEIQQVGTTHHTEWWILGSVLGWTLASGMTAISDSLFQSQSLRGLSGAAAYLGIVAGGGLVLGLVTGVTLAWLPRREAEHP